MATSTASAQSCVGCKDHDLRCTEDTPCQSCQKSKAQCDPAPPKIRFRSVPRRRQTFDFAPDQTWVQSKKRPRLTYVDMTPHVARDRATSDSDVCRNASGVSAVGDRVAKKAKFPSDGTRAAPPRSQSSSCLEGKRYDGRSPSTASSETTIPDKVAARSSSYPVEHTNMRNQPPTVTLGASERSRYPPGPLHGLPTSHSDAAYLNLEEACLLRHFTQNLAQWFDISDRDRHFALHVPERAMFCPVLRYAVYTASAGHLNRLASCGKPLETLGFPEEVRSLLSPETAIRYHDICISYLFEISHDSEEVYNEDVLTAATILRFYEQIEAPSLGDSEAYLNAIQFNVNTQQDESFYAWFKIHGPSRDINVHACPSVSLRHSAALSALRQEIWSAFLYQREFRLPVSPTNDYTMCDAANDFIWTNRILVWVADLLLFCFGDNHRSSAEERLQRWSKLKTVEERWKEAKPAPYKPIHYRDREPTVGKHFPEIWHMNSCQVAGAQHIELGRILLAVSDPRRASRLGLGALSRDKALVQELQDCTRRLCGLAVSNPPCPAALVTAMVGISICGEYFTDPGEQGALIRLLEGLEWDHAWPTASTINALQTAWGRPT